MSMIVSIVKCNSKCHNIKKAWMIIDLLNSIRKGNYMKSHLYGNFLVKATNKIKIIPIRL